MTARTKKRVEIEWLSPAECASRTGLTVRALRVYERRGLITPKRLINGWRRYGPAELSRLNTIVMLKEWGLTLVEIKSVINEQAPSLLRILHIQRTSLRAQHASIARALALTEIAQSRLESNQKLSIDELCNLIKSSGAHRRVEMKKPSLVMRELINEHITPDEERAWATWWAEHPEELAVDAEFRASQRALMAELQELSDNELSPSSPEVQKLMESHNDLLRQYNVRERAMMQLAWNESVTLKWYAIGAKARNKQKLRSVTEMASAAELNSEGANLFGAALKESARGKAMLEIIAELSKLLREYVDPESEDVDALVNRFSEACNQYQLGDPVVYARWAPFIAKANMAEGFEFEQEAAWGFLERAVRARLQGVV